MKSIFSFPWSKDRVLSGGLGLAGLISGSVVLLILVFVTREAMPAFLTPGIGRMLQDDRWLPGSERSPQFSVVAMLVGSLFVTFGSLILAAPWGLLIAVYGRFFARPWIARWNRRMLELLAGIPSVVIGFWGLTVLVPWIHQIHAPGQSMLAACLVLTLMILPTIALTADAALAAVPREDLLGASALGLGCWATVTGVALPAARSGIAGGMGLAMARAVGETMAVVMVCGNIPQIPRSIFDPIRPATATIALEMGYATTSHRAVLFAVAFLLIVAIAGVYSLRLFTHRFRK